MGTVAAEDYQAIQLHLLVIVLHVFDFIHAVFVDDTHQLKWLPRSAQNGAAERKDAGKIFRFHALIIAFDQAAVTVVNAINFHIVAEFFIQRFCNAANSCIEALAVSTARQNTNSFHQSHILFTSIIITPNSGAEFFPAA